MDLMKRLGVKITLTDEQVRRTEELQNEWIAGPSTFPPSFSSPESRETKPVYKIPDHVIRAIQDHLRKLSQKLQASREPVLSFTRPGPEDSQSLYASIKLEEILDRLIDLLESRFENGVLSGLIRIVECVPIKVGIVAGGSERLVSTKRKPIKLAGDHLIRVELLAEETETHESFEFLVRVER